MIIDFFLLICTLETSDPQRFLYLLQAEFTISKKNSTNLFHVQKASIPMKKGGYLIYASGHAHRGVINATLYGQVKFNIIHLTKFC